MDPNRIIYYVVDTGNVDAAESNKDFADMDRVHLHRGSPF
jgi:hypothetical protein